MPSPEPAADPDPGHQLVEVVDRHGAVVDVVTRARMRAEHLPHRTVFVAVIDTEDRVVVHQRADWKDVWPSRWDVSFGGVVAPGEGWRDAAVRELAEEAGVVVDPSELRYAWNGWYDDGTVRELGWVFVVRHDGPFTLTDGEVAAIDRVALVDLPGWLGAHDVVDDALALVVPSLLPG